MYNVKIEDNQAEIYLYSAILGAEYGLTVSDVIERLNAYTGKTITLHINSEGGDVFEAQGMYAYLRNHKAKVHVYIDGLCASSAGIVALSGDKIFMRENALFMMHNPSGAVYGESEDMRKLADILDKIRDSIAILYEQKMALEHEKVLDMMKAETWLTAQEAYDMNLVDEIIPALKVKNESKDYQAGVKAERERLQALDDIIAPGREALIEDAKYTSFKTVNDIALELLKSDARHKDAVKITPNIKNADASIDDIRHVSELINRMRGY